MFNKCFQPGPLREDPELHKGSRGGGGEDTRGGRGHQVVENRIFFNSLLTYVDIRKDRFKQGRPFFLIS